MFASLSRYMTRRNSVGLTYIQYRESQRKRTSDCAEQRYNPVMRLGLSTGTYRTKTWLPTTMRLIAQLPPMSSSNFFVKTVMFAHCIDGHTLRDTRMKSFHSFKRTDTAYSAFIQPSWKTPLSQRCIEKMGTANNCVVHKECGTLSFLCCLFCLIAY